MCDKNSKDGGARHGQASTRSLVNRKFFAMGFHPDISGNDVSSVLGAIHVGRDLIAAAQI